jgi:hypothetical protein
MKNALQKIHEFTTKERQQEYYQLCRSSMKSHLKKKLEQSIGWMLEDMIEPEQFFLAHYCYEHKLRYNEEFIV